MKKIAIGLVILFIIVVLLWDDEEIVNSSTDTYTLMVYMCGSNLESEDGSASGDIDEMLSSQLAKEVNLLVYTGGATYWQTDGISSNRNQIFKVENKELNLVDDSIGLKYMSRPETLSYFLNYSIENYPADKYGLILWDHGGGPVSGFGYDEHDPDEEESLTIDELKSALNTIDVKLDFVGFDACLMANVETAYAIKDKANYLIASEEIEPGDGWEYKKLLNQLSRNTAQTTEEFAKVVIDSYIDSNNGFLGSDATLSIVDLNKIDNVYNSLVKFMKNVEQDKLLRNDYASVAKAVGKTKAFADGDFDIIDLLNFAENVDVSATSELKKALNDCVVYNKTTSDIENSNGLSIYFPSEELSYYDKMLSVYRNIGFSQDYINVLTEYVNILAGGNRKNYKVNNHTYTQTEEDYSNYDWYDSQYINQYSNYYEETQIGEDELEIEDKGEYYALVLDDEDWDNIKEVSSSVWFDVGDGYVDLGTDSYYEQDEDGDLIISFDGTWVSINGNTVMYEVIESTDKYEKGRVPVMLNDEEYYLVIYWDEKTPDGVVLGADPIDECGNTTLQGKGYKKLKKGDKIEFIFDYYTYNGDYEDSYIVGDPLYVGDDDLTVSYEDIGEGNCLVYYIITDIYNNIYYTESVELY